MKPIDRVRRRTGRPSRLQTLPFPMLPRDRWAGEWIAQVSSLQAAQRGARHRAAWLRRLSVGLCLVSIWLIGVGMGWIVAVATGR